MKKLIAVFLSGIILASVAQAAFAQEKAAEPGREIIYENKLLAGWERDDGTILFNPQDTASRNGNVLVYLLNNDSKKTIVLPPQKIIINRTLNIGDNTTIIADGATIVQEGGAKSIIDHAIDKTSYESLKNVKISGGTWRITSAAENPSVMRFCHAQNVTVENVKITCKYTEHALSFVACKNCKLKNSKLLATGKTDPDRHEEALQIDIATPFTAPNCARAGAEFANGQTCNGITVTDCTIRGGCGISSNKVTYKNKAWQDKMGVSGTEAQCKAWLKKHHLGITVKNSDVTGMTGEAVVLYNAAKINVSGNRLTSKCTKLNDYYSVALNIRSSGKNSITSSYESSVKSNIMKGGYIGFYVGTNYSNKYGKFTIKNNKIYCKKGKARAMILLKCKTALKNNKLYKWK